MHCLGTESQHSWAKNNEPEERVVGGNRFGRLLALPNQEKAFVFYIQAWWDDIKVFSAQNLIYILKTKLRKWILSRTRVGRLLLSLPSRHVSGLEKGNNGELGGRVKGTCNALHMRGKGKRRVK